MPILFQNGFIKPAVITQDGTLEKIIIIKMSLKRGKKFFILSMMQLKKQGGAKSEIL